MEDMKRRLFISGIFVALLVLALLGVFLRSGR
jgi:hypothetical protein